MAITIHNDVLDAALDEIATATGLSLTSQQPTTRTEAHVTHMLATVVVTPGDGNGDFTVEEGDTSGRQVAVAEQAAFSVTNTGTATFVNLYDGSDLLYSADLASSQALTAGNTVTVPTFDIEIRDFVAE